MVIFLLLNPSTAAAKVDDPTTRRGIGFAPPWRFADLVVTNPFALRSTDPRAPIPADDPIGLENDVHVVRQAKAARLVVCAWGVRGGLGERSAIVLRMLGEGGVQPH